MFISYDDDGNDDVDGGDDDVSVMCSCLTRNLATGHSATSNHVRRR